MAIKKVAARKSAKRAPKKKNKVRPMPVKSVPDELVAATSKTVQSADSGSDEAAAPAGQTRPSAGRSQGLPTPQSRPQGRRAPKKRAHTAKKAAMKSRRRSKARAKSATPASDQAAARDTERASGIASPPAHISGDVAPDAALAGEAMGSKGGSREMQAPPRDTDHAPRARRTRRRRPRGRLRTSADPGQAGESSSSWAAAADEPTEASSTGRAAATPDQPATESPGPPRRVAPKSPTDPGASSEAPDDADARTAPEEKPGPKRRGRRRGARKRKRSASQAAADTVDGGEPAAPGDVRVAAKDEDAASGGPSDADDARPRGDASSAKTGSRQMLINTSAGEECRIAVLQDGRLEELFIERQSAVSHVGNIYKGRVTNVEPSIQAVFVDFGLPRNGFLHISDLHTRYFPERKADSEDVGRKISRRDRPPIQNCLRRGQEVIVQITKEGVGTKGPTLTTYLSIPGRYLVMMPGMSKLGVSRKIEDDDARRTMRSLLNELTLPDEMGFILRTAGLDQSKRELQRDLNYLTRLWRTLKDRQKKLPAPVELYQESDLVTRTIRDIHTSDFRRIVVDEEATLEKVQEFLRIVMPRTRSVVELYTNKEPLFHGFGIEEEIARLNSRHVPLPSGGSIVIDSHEAMVTIDVNSGRFRTPDNAEETALKIDLEAAEEIARQLRLRDLGGLIVCDFIDMRSPTNCRKVVQALKNALKKHKERVRVLNMSPFGLVEITRQRQRPSILRSIYSDCPHCHGRGLVKTPESMSLDVARFIQFAAHRDQVHEIRITVSHEVAHEVLNRKRADIVRIESETGKSIIISGSNERQGDAIDIKCLDSRGGLVELPVFGEPATSGKKTKPVKNVKRRSRSAGRRPSQQKQGG